MREQGLVFLGLIVSVSHGFSTPGRVTSVPALTRIGDRKREHVAQRSKGSSKLFISLDDTWADIASKTSSSLPQWSKAAATPEAGALSWTWKPSFSLEWVPNLMDSLPGIAGDTTNVKGAVSSIIDTYSSLPVWAEAAVVAVPLLALTAATLFSISFPPEDYRSGMEPYPRGQYDPIQAKAYYAEHKFLVLQRILQLLRLSNRFLINLAIDKYILKREEEKRPERAKDLLQLITTLGPTAIKIGQALSVRPDLIAAEYAVALATLQDRVPAFPSNQAREILKRELGAEKLSKIQGMSFDQGPVASASIGQVYKGTIENQDVAIKVQRPNVLAEIALDLYIVREFAPIYQKFTGGATDLQGLANEWGRGFIAELDYKTEAKNTIRFNVEMKKRNLNAVCAPRVITDYSTEQVLITEWVDGKRLDQSDADDVPRLCAVALNAYLVMLLEMQSLHCDPHPGNLLRRNDGTLCILDFGMTLDIPQNLQYSLLEYVAHLTSESYEELPEDLAKLGFLKQDKVEFARRSGVLEPLKYFLRQAGQGGGADAVRERIFDEYRQKFPGLDDDELRVEMRAEMKQNMQQIVERETVSGGLVSNVEDLQRQNRDSFMIPEWFLYTSRAFLTLEGVSLQADPNYSLIKSCFPYVAKRLVADDDPRAIKALRDLLYGASDAIDVTRVTDLAEGFSSYTTTTKTLNEIEKRDAVSVEAERKKKMVEAEATITLVKDSADILLSPNGNLVQNLLVQESALATSAGVKDRIRDAFVEGPQRFRDSLPLGIGSLLPPLPFEEQIRPFVRKTDAEVKAQALVEKVAALLPSTSVGESNTIPTEKANQARNVVLENLRGLEPEQAALVIKELRENLPSYSQQAGQLGGKFLSKLFKTAEHNIESTLSELELAGKEPDLVFRTTVKGLSSAAKSGATAFTPTKES